MDKINEEGLEKIGLNRNEAKVYLALLDLGPSSIGDISSEAKIHRTNAYDSIKRLLEKGLVTYTTRERDVRVFEAGSPENFINIINEKRIILDSILPSLKIKSEMTSGKSHACIHEGITAFTRILEHFLEYKEPILVYGIPRKAPEMMRHFIPGFHKRRIPKKIKMLHIYNQNAEDRIAYLNSLPYSEARYLPQQFDSEVSTNICGDEVVLVIWSDPIITIQIRNPAIAESYKRYFDVLWKAAR